MKTGTTFRAGALVLALTAAGLTSGVASAASADTKGQTWLQSTEGTKDVSWGVQKNSEFSFTVNPTDLTASTYNRGVNIDTGTWSNGGQSTKLSFHNQMPIPDGKSLIGVAATGYSGGQKTGERLIVTWVSNTDGRSIPFVSSGTDYVVKPTDHGGTVPTGDTGRLSGLLLSQDGAVVTTFDNIKSTKFVLNMTATKTQP